MFYDAGMKPEDVTKLLVVAVALLSLGLFFAYEKIRRAKIAPPPIAYPQPIAPIPITPQQPQNKLTVEQAVATITEKECRDHVYKLADDAWEGRMSGKRGNVLAAAYVKEQFESYGLKTMYDKFSIRRENPGPKNETGDDFTQNVYAWIEGTDLKDEIVVVGAHLDHIGYGPSMSRAPSRREIHNGADDNASGTSAVLEIAQAFATLPPPRRTIVFQAYSAEEMGLIGSRHYCDKPKFPTNAPDIRKHVFMCNLDMIGFLNQGFYYVGWGLENSSVDVAAIVKELNQQYTFAQRITSRGGGGSDHACFYNKKVPVAFLHTGLHDWYHTPDDDANRLNYNGMERVSRYAFELSYRVANGPSAPRFNYESFRELPYTHDHGHPENPLYHHYHKNEQLPEGILLKKQR